MIKEHQRRKNYLEHVIGWCTDMCIKEAIIAKRTKYISHEKNCKFIKHVKILNKAMKEAYLEKLDELYPD